MSFGSNSDIRGIFSHPIHPERTPEYGEENQNDEYVLEKNGDDFDEHVYEDTEHEQIEEVIPEEPIKKVRTKKDPQENKDGLLIYSVTSKISEEDKEFIDDLTVVLGRNTAGAIRQCISDAREAEGEEIKRAAQKIRKIMKQK